MHNPLIHASSAALYITGVVWVLQYFEEHTLEGTSEFLIVPITFLSLFVLSVLVMSYLFFYEPFRLYFDNKKKEALTFFSATVGSFACFVLLFLLALVYFSGALIS